MFKKFFYCIFFYFCLVVQNSVIATEQPFISIIVSAYNAESYLQETINSILRQTDDSWELILVNDGSTDDTFKIIQKAAKRSPKIRVINQENEGLSLARNHALKLVTGNYVWFVDADDFIRLDSIKILKKELSDKAYPDILSIYVQPFDNTGLLPLSFYNKFPKLLHNGTSSFNSCDLSCQQILSYPVTSGKNIYKLDFLKKNKIEFIPNLVFEDDVFFLTSLSYCAQVFQLPEMLYFKRRHAQSIVSNKPKYYDSTVKLPQLLYLNLKNYNEGIKQCVYNSYFEGIFSKWPNNLRFLPDLQNALDFIKNQPKLPFWVEKEKKLSAFIQVIQKKAVQPYKEKK